MNATFFDEEGGEAGYYSELQGTCIERKVTIFFIYARAVQAVL